jgi:hypothetical protein
MQYESEYWDRVRQAFYKQVKETNWGVEEHRVSKPRGRKAKPIVIAEQKPRTVKEYQAQKYNWL